MKLELTPKRSVYLLFPLLLLYIGLVIGLSGNTLVGDEPRHIGYAVNLTNGFYTDAENPEFRNGPGYPIVLALLSSVKAPYKIMKLCNALFIFIAVFFVFKSISMYFEIKQSLIFGYIFGLYPPFLKWILFLNSESLAILLASGFIYFFLRAHNQSKNRIRNGIISALLFGYLVLTKVIFGYVILVTILICLAIYIFKKNAKTRFSLLILAGGFLLCLPYLFYTYSLTGKVFYWGTQGGELLYWRSTPFPNEYGDWISTDVVMGRSSHDFYDTSELALNHRAFYESIAHYSHVERDAMFKEKAIENMKAYPVKYLENTAASAFRLFFNYPHSYTPQKISSFFYILPNGLLLGLIILSMFITIKNPLASLYETRLIGLMALIFIGGLIILNGKVRHLVPVIPLVYISILQVLSNGIQIRIGLKSVK